VKETYKFCLALLKLGQHRCRAMTNYVMGLCSSPSLHHPVEITNSPFCHYTYSNLTKVLSFWELSNDVFLKFIKPYLPAGQVLSNGKSYRVLSHDLTKLLKPHSPSLPNRGYVVESNSVAQNLSLNAGYYVSALHVNDQLSGSALPLLVKRLEVESDKTAEILAQIETVMQCSDLPFKEMLTLLNGDSAYGKATIIAPLHDYDNLIGVLRMRSGIKVWTCCKNEQSEQKGGGAPRVYGEKYYLRETDKEVTNKKSGLQSTQFGINSLEADEVATCERTMKNNREVVVAVKRWNNLLIRSKGEAKMKDKPFDILHVSIRDKQTDELVFDRPMYLAVTGKSRQELTGLEAQTTYRQRFDVEVNYRFCNQSLLMNKLQSPEIKHQDTWLNIVKLCCWLLFVSTKEIIKIDFPVWQKYLPINKDRDLNVVNQVRVTLSQAQKSIHRLFCTFDKKPFLPQKCKKGRGRKTGSTFKPRKKYPIVRKTKKKRRLTPPIDV
jgi:hypothetical protein